MILICSISNTASAQQWQNLLSVESRVGYSSNTYLNPYFSEWDRSLKSGYGTLSVLGQTTRFDRYNVVQATAGAVFEPFLESREAWKGGLGLLSYQRKFSGKLSGGFETGASYFTSSFDRTLAWVQPVLTWFPSPFTQFRVKAGTNFRRYHNYMVDSIRTDHKSRFDLYSLEFETWPNFRWQLTAGLYGGLNTLPAIGEGFSSVATAAYVFKGGGKIRLKAGLEQYQNSTTTTVSGGGNGGGFPPVGGPGGPVTETVRQTSRMFRFGISSTVPAGDMLSLFGNVEGLQFRTSGGSDFDMLISAGVRMTLQPGRGNRAGAVEPVWDKRDGNRYLVQIRYAGEGQLYLVGDFNNWTRPGIPLVEQGDKQYTARLHLETGTYEYKVLRVSAGEESWLELSGDTYVVEDGFGGENAMLLIE